MEVVRAFNNELSSLYEGKPPISKAKMSQVTRAAIKGLRFYKHIVQSVEKFIQKCRPEYKVPGLYVIDSIVRQSRHQFGNDKDVFVPRFSKNIVLTFQHLYKCPVEERPRIVRVLNIWQKNNVFPTEVIQPLLDMANMENPSAGLPSSQQKSDQDDWKSWNASSQAVDNTIIQTQSQKGDMADEHINDHDLHGGGISVLEGRSGGVKLNSGIMSQLQELTSQLLNNNNNMPDSASKLAAAPVTPTAVSQSPAKTTAKELKDENTVKFNKKLLDFDYGEEEEEEDAEEEEKEENGHSAPTEPTALALSMAQNLLSNPDLLRQLQQMQQTIQQTEAFNASLTADSSTPQQHTSTSCQQAQNEQIPLSSVPLPHHNMSTPTQHGMEDSRSHLSQNSYSHPPPGRINTPNQSHMPALFSDITIPQSLPPNQPNYGSQPNYPPPPLSVPLYPPLNNAPMIPPPSAGMCASPAQMPQQPLPGMMGKMPMQIGLPQGEPDYMGPGSIPHPMIQDEVSSSSLILQDRDERSLWQHSKDEDDRVIQSNLPPPRKERSRSRSRTPVKGSSSNRSSNRSSSRRSGRRSRSRSPRRKRDSSRSPQSGSSRHSRRGDDSRSSRGEKRSSQSEYSSRDPERERERERDRERRHKGMPPLRKGFLAVCSTTLWLGHVPKITSDVEINEIFSEYGTVSTVDHIPPRGCAFVVMARRQDAVRALQKLRNLKVQGSLIKMAWAPGKGVKGQEYKEFWDVEQGVTFIPHEKIESNIDLEALQEGGALDMDSLPEKLKELHKSKEQEMDTLPKDLAADSSSAIPQPMPVSQIPQPATAPQPQQTVQVAQPTPAAAQTVPTTVSDVEQQQAAILANAASGVAAVAAATATGQLNPGMVPPPAALQQQFSLPLSGMVPSQPLMIPQMPLPLGVPPPNSMVLMPHNTLGPGGQPMTVLNALAPTPGLPPGANPGHPGAMGLVDANERPSDEELSAALVSNAALMGGFPPQMAGFPPGPFPPGARPPLHPNHMMGGPQWPPNMPGQGPFIRPPGGPALQPFGRLLPGPIPGTAQGVFNPAGPPNRNSMLPGFNPVPIPTTQPQQQQQTPSQQSTQSSPQTSSSQVSSGPDGERKMSPTLLEQEYNRFVATKGVNNQTSARKNFPTSPGGSGPASVGMGGNPNLEPLGTRPSLSDPAQRMLGPGNSRGPMGPQGMPPGPEMGFRHPRPMMGFPNPRGGSPQGGAMGMNRFPFPGGRLQRPFMRGRGGMDFRGPRPGFGGDWGRPPHMGRDPYFDERDFPMGRRDWDMERDADGMFPDRPWGGPHGEMDDRFMGRGRMDEEFRGPRPRDDEFGRQREDFGRSRDEFGGPRKRDEFGRHREDFGPRNRDDYDGPRGRENDLGGQRNRDEEFGGSNRDGVDVENGRWNRGQDSYRDNYDRDSERDSDRDRSRRRDRDRDRDRESDRDRNRDSDRDKESDRDRNRDSDRDKDSDRDRNRDSDRDKDRDRDRDRNRDRDSDRKRGRERRERTRWNRSSSREKESSAKPANEEPNEPSTAPAESQMATETEQPMEAVPIVEPAIPDSVFKAPLPVMDIPAPSSGKGGNNDNNNNNNNDEGEPHTDHTGPEVNYDESSVPSKENSFAFSGEKQKFMETETPIFAEPINTDVQPAHDFHAEDAFNSEPFESAYTANPDANMEMPVKNVVSVDSEVDESVQMETQQEENGNEATVDECP